MLTYMAATLQPAAQTATWVRPPDGVALGRRGRRTDQGGELVRLVHGATGRTDMDVDAPTQMVEGDTYEAFRAEVRETFTRQGWICTGSDEESDYLVRGRWWLYAAPGDVLEPDPTKHRVVLFEFPSEASRRRWDAEPEGELDKATLHRAPSAEAAVDLLTQLDPAVVRGS